MCVWVQPHKRKHMGLSHARWHIEHEVGAGSIKAGHQASCSQAPECLSALDIGGAHALAPQTSSNTSDVGRGH